MRRKWRRKLRRKKQDRVKMQQWRGLIERVNLWLVIDADNVDKRQLP